jgi:xylulokinase
MRDAGLPAIQQVRVSGGGAKSSLWRQILADVLESDLVTVNTAEGAAYGAALLAAVGANVFPDVESACAALIQVTGFTEPGEGQGVYREAYPAYRDLYPALRPSFEAVSGGPK